MAKTKNTQKEAQTSADSFFNVRPIHVARIRHYLENGMDKVIIHGDGMMFGGEKGKLYDGKTIEEGSDHHREFNSGVAEINKNEIVSRAKFRAIYEKGGELPESPDDIIKEFHINQAKETVNETKAQTNNGFSNSITIEDPK